MAILSASQIASHAGLCFPGDTEKTAIATAIALAESGGNTEAIGDGGQSVGLWQIHLPSHPQYSKSSLLDPVNNMSAMCDISRQGTYWNPWSVYKNGAYLRYLDEAKSVADVGGPTSELSVSERLGDLASDPFGGIALLVEPFRMIASAMKSVVDIVIDAARWVGDPENWIRILQVSAGGVLVLIAGSIVARPIVQPMVKTVKKGLV